MIAPEHILSNQRETSFTDAPGTSSYENATVPAENSIANQPDLSQNQVAVTSPNTIARQSSESFDDQSYSSESDVTEGQLVKREEKNPIAQQSPQINIENKVSNAERTHITTHLKTEYHAPIVKVVNHHYYGNSSAHEDNVDRTDVVPKKKITIDKNPDDNVEHVVEPKSSDTSSQPLFTEDQDKSCLKSCWNKRCIAIVISTSLGVSLLILLCIWLSNSNKTKKSVIPATPITSTTINADDLLSTTDQATDLAPTSTQVIHVSTEVLSNESTTIANRDYSRNTEQKQETNEITGANNSLKIVARHEWDAAAPLMPLTKLKVLPAARVIISETSTESCDETEQCMKLIRKIQRLYSNRLSCPDIAYNFLIGGDGLIYEGRGWDVKGKVADYFDHESINIAFIGNFSLFTPPDKQVEAALKLIRFGVENNNIIKLFKLSGKRQLTYFNENPGDKLYNIITKWQHWDSGIIGKDINNKAFDDEYNQTMSYLKLFSGTNMKYLPKRGRN